MNFGKTILDLRRAKNVTQEELAAELGVTAAAVSKWENNYTLPDILMLCALADYFEVSTDELLGRNTNWKYTVIGASTSELGKEIQTFIKQHGFMTKQIHTDYSQALMAAKTDPSVTHLFTSFATPMNDEERGDTDNLICIESHADTTQHILDGFDIYIRNMEAYDIIARNSKK